MKAPAPVKTAVQNRLRRLLTLVFLVPAVLFVTLFVAAHRRRGAYDAVRPATVSSLATNWQAAIDLAPSAGARRPVFPYSVIPGGVRDAQELRSAAAKDPVVAAHYADFRLTSAHTIRLAQPVAMYVSYRLNNRVYWTRNRMTIPAGETLISDGENLARVRCGNRLSVLKADPVSTSEPLRDKLDTPDFVPPLLASLAPSEDSEGFAPPTALPPIPLSPGAPGGFGPPIYPPILPPGVVPPKGGVNPTSPPPVSTPEPGTWQLLFAGILLLGLIAALHRK